MPENLQDPPIESRADHSSRFSNAKERLEAAEGGIPEAIRRSDSGLANVIVAAAFIGLFVGVSRSGGIDGAPLHWFALVPPLAFAMGARRSAVLWSFASLIAICSMAAIDLDGWPLMNDSGRSETVMNTLWLRQAGDAVL